MMLIGVVVDDPVSTALDLLTGRWRSQILHAGIKLGIVDQLANGRQTSATVGAELSLNADNTYRLMRALASIGILQEDDDQGFRLTPTGELFGADHPDSMRGVCLWEEGELLYTVWKHLPDIVREGGPDGFRREFKQPAFEYITSNAEIASLFNNAMTSYSRRETVQILSALKGVDLSDAMHVCDIAGGQGYLLCHLLQLHPHLRGTVLELPSTLEDPATLLANQMNLDDRCKYLAGNMFEDVPAADGYFLKHILHDWNDAECTQILEIAHRASDDSARVFIAENVVPGPENADFSKLFDIHMMAVLTGRERTEPEFIALLEDSGWHHAKTWRQPESTLAVVEGVKA